MTENHLSSSQTPRTIISSSMMPIGCCYFWNDYYALTCCIACNFLSCVANNKVIDWLFLDLPTTITTRSVLKFVLFIMCAHKNWFSMVPILSYRASKTSQITEFTHLDKKGSKFEKNGCMIEPSNKHVFTVHVPLTWVFFCLMWRTFLMSFFQTSVDLIPQNKVLVAVNSIFE